MLLCIHGRAVQSGYQPRHVLYSTTLPMCHCIHVKDKLPQLSYKNISEKTGTVCLALPLWTSAKLKGLKLSRPPHSEAIMCMWEHTPDKAPCVFMWCTLTPKWFCDFKGFDLAVTQVFRTLQLQSLTFFSATAVQCIYTLQLPLFNVVVKLLLVVESDISTMDSNCLPIILNFISPILASLVTVY